MMNENLLKKINLVTKDLEDIWKEILAEGKKDEQEVLEFLDYLNNYSIRN